MVIDWTNWRCRSALICLILMIWLHMESRKALVSSKLFVTATFFSMVVNNFFISRLLEAARESSAMRIFNICWWFKHCPNSFSFLFLPFSQRCVLNKNNFTFVVFGNFHHQHHHHHHHNTNFHHHCRQEIEHPPTAMVLGAPLVSP